MSCFPAYIERVLAHEGGYVNDPRDPGGETQWGIAKASYPKVNIRTLTRDGAIEIYRRDFWMKTQADKLPNAIAFQLLDAAVNHGPGRAIMWLQRAVGVADDGNWGLVSQKALNGQDLEDVILRFVAERIDFYTRLSTFKTYGVGWLRRMVANLRYASIDN